jgi:putative FmdB family regulatory protein
MPIYEYHCTSCHHQFECIQKMSDEPIKKCPHCSKNDAQRLISAAGFQLKGTGWYATDYKDKPKSANKPDSQPSTVSEKPSSDVPATPTPATQSVKD